VELASPSPLDHSCTLCPFHAKAQSVCVSAEAIDGDSVSGPDSPSVLVVGMYPGMEENRRGRPNVGVSGGFIRKSVESLWSGPIVYDNAIKCYVGNSKVGAKSYAACRPYLAQVYRSSNAERVILMGAAAVQGFLGRSVPPVSVRHGYAYLSDGTPAFILPHPARLMQNRLLRARWIADLKWALHAEPAEHQTGAEAVVVYTQETIKQAHKACWASAWVALDVETSGRLYEGDLEMLSLSLTPKGSDRSYVWDEDSLANPTSREALRGLLGRDNSPPVVAHNAKFDISVVKKVLGAEPRVHGDTMLWRALVAPEARVGLAVCAELVGLGGHKEEADELVNAEAKRLRKLGVKNPKAYAYAALPLDVLIRYNARDTLTTARLAELLEPAMRHVHDGALWRTWQQLVGPGQWAIGHVENWGMKLDADGADSLDVYLATEIGALQLELDQHADINWNSTQQLARLLYEDMGLPCLKYTDKGNPSTAAEVLEALAPRAEIVRTLLEFRSASKLRSTYVKGLLEALCPDGRIHPSYKLHGARSGRLSCEKPNLQNIPRADTELGKKLRDLFIPEDGHVFIQADFGQFELRIAAMLSGDPEMIKVFQSDEDYHLRTAKMVAREAWGIAPGDVTDEHRTIAKTINFGVLYGQDDENLAAQIGCTVQVAAAVRKAIMGRFSVLDNWTKAQIKETRQTGHTWTYWQGKRARRRPLWAIADAEGHAKGTATRGSFNTPIQGTASDYCLASVVKIVRWILDEDIPAKLVLTVHDSVMLEVLESEAISVALTVQNIMETWPSGDVPLVADLKMGPSWGSLEKLEI
jgi:DNA polymerase-1